MNKPVIRLCMLLLFLSLCACGKQSSSSADPPRSLPAAGDGVSAESRAEESLSDNETDPKEEPKMKMKVTAGKTEIIFELNDSQAAKDLYSQLPLTLEVEDFSTNEKVFYPPENLNTQNAPMADAGKGTLAYYEPWGDVVMFYAAFGSGRGLYELGQAISGADSIETLNGTIEITAENESFYTQNRQNRIP